MFFAVVGGGDGMDAWGFVRVNGLILFGAAVVDVVFSLFLGALCIGLARWSYLDRTPGEREGERERERWMHACMHGVERRDSARGFWD